MHQQAGSLLTANARPSSLPGITLPPGVFSEIDRITHAMLYYLAIRCNTMRAGTSLVFAHCSRQSIYSVMREGSRTNGEKR